MTKYHVTPKWDGGDLKSAKEFYGSETAAIKQFCEKWGADVEHAYHHVTYVFLHDTLDEAREFQAEYGGEILAIDDTYLEITIDGVEGYPCVYGRISKDDIIGVVADDGIVAEVEVDADMAHPPCRCRGTVGPPR